MSDILSQDVPQKQCSSCKLFFPHTSDYFSVGRAQCKKCRCNNQKKRYQCKKYAILNIRKQYYQENRESIKSKHRAYFHINKEEDNNRSKKWYHSHREESKKHSRFYRHAHKDEIAAYQRKYRQDNRERLAALRKQYRYSAHGGAILRMNALKQRVRRFSAPGSHTAQQLCDQLKRQKNKCYWCGKKLGKQWHADHIFPLSRGGSNNIDNIVISCPSCNLRKHNKLPHEWSDGGRLL